MPTSGKGLEWPLDARQEFGVGSFTRDRNLGGSITQERDLSGSLTRDRDLGGSSMQDKDIGVSLARCCDEIFYVLPLYFYREVPAWPLIIILKRRFLIVV
jgi:hypothetical protein